MREIGRQYHHGRRLIRKAIDHPEPEGYRMKEPRPSPVLAPYKSKIDALTLETTMEHPVDVECAYAGSELYLLQCRPITTLE